MRAGQEESDKALHDIARRFPVTRDEMRTVNGVGDVKLSEYGLAFLAAIRAFIASHPEATSKTIP